MWRPTLDICRPSLGAPRAWYPGTVLWALGAELTLTPPSALPPGASLALGPTCGWGAARSAPWTVLVCLPADTGARGRAIWTFACCVLCPTSSSVGGPAFLGSGPHPSSQRTLSSCLLSVENLRPESGRGQPRVTRGQRQRLGSWLRVLRCIPAHAGPTRPLQGTAGTRRGPYSPLRLRGHRFPFHVERRLTAYLQEQLGFVFSAVARRLQQAGQSRLCPGTRSQRKHFGPGPGTVGG